MVRIFINLLVALCIPGWISPMADTPSIKSSAPDVPTEAAFCDVVKNPQLYFDKTVRVTAIFEQAAEGQYLRDDGCPLSENQHVGVGYARGDKKQAELQDKNIDLIHSAGYAGRAMVTVVGVLRNAGGTNPFFSYKYRFEIIRFDRVSHITTQYGGVLTPGESYVAEVRRNRSSDLSFVIPIRAPYHYSARVEWTNLSDFPVLNAMGPRSATARIIFNVLSDNVRQMTVNPPRWARTIHCKVISVE